MSRPKRKPAENQMLSYLRWCERVRRMTPSTLAAKRKILRAFIRELKLENATEVNDRKLNWWVAAKTSGKFGYLPKPATMHNYACGVIVWLKWLRDMDICRIRVRFPMVVVPPSISERRNWYTAEQIEEVLQRCDNLRDEVMIRVLFDSGLRATEFTSLRLSDLRGRDIQVFGKGRKHGWAHISEQTEERLKLWMKTAAVKDHLWIKAFGRSYYEPLGQDAIRKRLVKVFAAAGFPRFQLHELRHSFATDLRRRGAEIDVVSKLLRHSNIRVTQRYLHNLDGEMRGEYDKFKNYRLAPNLEFSTSILGGSAENCKKPEKVIDG